MCDTFRAVLLVRLTADKMHGRREKSRSWSRSQLHGYGAKLTVFYGVEIFADNERPTQTRRRHRPKMDKSLGRLDHTLGQLIQDIVGLKKAVQQDREDIRELQENTDNVQHRLDRLEQELHSLAADIIKNGRHGIQLLPDMIELFILLFADDIVLLSDTIVGLQNQLDVFLEML